MRICITLFLAITSLLAARADTFSYRFDGTPLTDALAMIIRQHPEVNISFIYNDLETYLTSAHVHADDPYTALRQLTAFNPVRVISHRGTYFVEAFQQGRYRYHGRTVDTAGKPVEAATVMALAPYDSTVITYGITDAEGRFTIPCDRTGVILKASSLGYHTTYFRPDGLHTGDIVMRPRPIGLKNVTVQPDMSYTSGDKSIFLPTRREKNASHGGADLLMAMAIPSIEVDPLTGSIRTTGGQGVATYIDFVPTSAADLADMRPQDVVRVEVYDFPHDARFGNDLHVVNFIMVKYEYGGYTKARALQRFVSPEGDYGLHSKFAYRRMTYDLSAGHAYSRTRVNGRSAVADYGFPDGTVNYTVDTDRSFSRDRTEFVSMRANYSSENIFVSNTAVLNYFSSPDNIVDSHTQYSSSAYPDGATSTHTTVRNLNAGWNGIYNFRLGRSFMLALRPDAAFSRNHSYYSYSYDGGENVNNVTETAWRTTLWTELEKNFGPHSASLAVKGELQRNSLDYLGTSPAVVDYRYRFIGFFASGRLSFGRFWAQPSARLFVTTTDFGSEHFKELCPGYFVVLGSSFGSHHRLSLASQFYQVSIPVAHRSPNLVIRTPILAVRGNPDLKAYPESSTSLRYEWIPSNSFSLGTFATFGHKTRPIYNVWTPETIEGREMMVSSYIREGGLYTLNAGTSATLRLLDNSLVLRATLPDYFVRRTGRHRFTDNFLHPSFQANYYTGNFYFNAQYRFSERSADISRRMLRVPSLLYLRAGWSHSGLNISIETTNPFSSGWNNSWSLIETENYRQTMQTFSADYHRRFALSVSYSIPYGKKVRQTDEPGRVNAIESGIVR